MERFTHFDLSELPKYGIVFDSNEEANVFVDFVIEELEINIGQRITQNLSSEKLHEFDGLSSHQEGKWLKKNCPNYKQIVLGESIRMAWNLLRYGRHISNNVRVKETETLLSGISKLNLKRQICFVLQQNGIKTISDILNQENIKNLNGMNNDYAGEIIRKTISCLVPTASNCFKNDVSYFSNGERRFDSSMNKDGSTLTTEEKSEYEDVKDNYESSACCSIGDTIIHHRYGTGIVVSINNDRDLVMVRVDFGTNRVKLLSYDWVKDHCIIKGRSFQ